MRVSDMEIAGKLKIDPRTTKILFDALTDIGLVNNSREGKYRHGTTC